MFAIENRAKNEMFAKRPFLFAKSAIFGKHVCNNICFFYAFLNIMGYVSGRIPDQRSYKRKNSGPSKKLDFTLFFASVKGFEPPAFRLGVYLGPGFATLHLSQNPLFSAKRQVLLYVIYVLYYFVLFIRELPVCTFFAIN